MSRITPSHHDAVNGWDEIEAGFELPESQLVQPKPERVQSDAFETLDHVAEVVGSGRRDVNALARIAHRYCVHADVHTDILDKIATDTLNSVASTLRHASRLPHRHS